MTLHSVFPTPVHYYAEFPVATEAYCQSMSMMGASRSSHEPAPCPGYYYRDPRESKTEATAWSTRSNSDSNCSQLSSLSADKKLRPGGKESKGSKQKKKASAPVPDLNQNTYKVKYKTELCRNFELQGFCKFGESCCYAHGVHELRSKTHLNSNYKSKICKHFHGEGGCPYGLRYARLTQLPVLPHPGQLQGFSDHPAGADCDQRERSGWAAGSRRDTRKKHQAVLSAHQNPTAANFPNLGSVS